MKAIFFTPLIPFLNVSNATESPTISSMTGSSQTVDVIMVLSVAIASVGIIGNFTVIIVFLNDKKLRKKIPNIFIIHQVSFRPIFTLPMLVFFFKIFFGGLKSFFVGPLIPLFVFLWVLKPQWAALLAVGKGVCVTHSPLVQHLLTSWQPTWQLSQSLPVSRHWGNLKLGPIVPQINALPTELCWLWLFSYHFEILLRYFHRIYMHVNVVNLW